MGGFTVVIVSSHLVHKVSCDEPLHVSKLPVRVTARKCSHQ